MEEREFSRRELESLARKLTADKVGLSEPEKAMLLAIFRMAAEHVSPVLPPASADLDELREQLVQSFLPDTGEKFMLFSHIRPCPPP